MTVPNRTFRDTMAFVPCQQCQRLVDAVALATESERLVAVHALSSHVISEAHPGAAFGAVAWLANNFGPRIKAAQTKES